MDAQFASQHLHNFTANRQAKSSAFDRIDFFADLLKWKEDFFQLFRRNAHPGVFHLKTHPTDERQILCVGNMFSVQRF